MSGHSAATGKPNQRTSRAMNSFITLLLLIATFLNEIYIEHYDSSIPDDLNLGALRLILKLKPQIILKSFFCQQQQDIKSQYIT